MTARDAWMLRDRETGEWQQHVFFEKPDTGRMIAGADFDVIPVRILAPGELDGPTKERCAAVADETKEMRLRRYAENGATVNAHMAMEAEDIALRIRALPDGGVDG